MIEISKWSNDPEQPFDNLMPVVRELIAHGNFPVSGGFILTQAGWECGMAQPIDFDLLQSKFVFPPTVELGRSLGEILDRLSWSVIYERDRFPH